MPFTVSHAAAVLPFQRVQRWLPLSALMVGSMAPDYAYFFSASANRLFTHSLSGLFTFSLPAGLLVWLLYARLLERPAVSLLPAPWCRKFPLTPRITAAVLARVSIAIVVGAATHVFWDSFTHGSTLMTDAFPVLRTRMPGFTAMPVYHFLQGLSSIAGLALLAAWAFGKRNAPDALASPPYAVTRNERVVAAIVIVAATAVFTVGYWLLTSDTGYHAQFFYAAIGCMSGFFIASCAIAIWLRLRHPAVATP